ncbi:hypothetical protein BDSB_23935 [Burkholderia dolosa PC543]|nr:hypothetical protein BDSB_23935 [Burkholderia dolosa PC543]
MRARSRCDPASHRLRVSHRTALLTSDKRPLRIAAARRDVSDHRAR